MAKATHAAVVSSGVFCRKTFDGWWTLISSLSLARLFGFLGNTDKADGTRSSGDGLVVNGGRCSEESRAQDKANHARAVCHYLVEE